MNKLFFKKLFFLFLALVIINGCKKGNNSNGTGADETPPEYYISFKVDGVQKKYTDQAIASLGYSTQDELFNCILQGYKGETGSGKEHIGIILFNNNKIAAMTYQDPNKATPSDGGEVPQVLINYIDPNGNGYITMGPMSDKNGNINTFPGSENIVADAKVVIARLTTTYVEGSFSGTSFLSTDATFKKKVVISEGKFILKAYSID